MNSTQEGAVRVSVRYRCRVHGNDVRAIGRYWCYDCLRENGEWQRVRWIETTVTAVIPDDC